jgi:hypothetical protein
MGGETRQEYEARMQKIVTRGIEGLGADMKRWKDRAIIAEAEVEHWKGRALLAEGATEALKDLIKEEEG